MDGAGGAIVTWQDHRSGTSDDIYAQHVLASGVVDPAWPVDGRALCSAAGNQVRPTIVADGAGGAIVTWEDNRVGGGDIYAQHVLASGVVDPAWPVDGRAVCTAANIQWMPTIVADGVGGAIITWEDTRSGNGDIYAQHVLASGAVDPAWPVNGRDLCTAADLQRFPTIVADGAGGAVVTWADYRLTSPNIHIYAQHVLASGAVDPTWPVNGRALCTAANSRFNPTIVADGAGGAIVTWQDNRNFQGDIYAQHVLASGAVDPAWPVDGRALCTVANLQSTPTIVADGVGGAIVAWFDYRASLYDIYAQHVLASGAVDPAWPVDGRALCTAAGDQFSPTIVSDGAGGAIITWEDYRSGNADIYAQHVLASGAVDPAWPLDGSGLSTAVGSQSWPVITSNGAGGALVSWEDQRAGQADIYAMFAAICLFDDVDPQITCPQNLVLECNATCGTCGGVAASHPAIQAFLNGATATDACDANPTVTHSTAPACFPIGITPITFTATDNAGNSSQCTRTVRVTDTTAPTITLSLNRTVLWPPNHKLVDIEVTVSAGDVCDPNPTFRLVSIISNEPDNGLGDGDTSNDIQGATFGTADTQFQLRAERAGGGVGRRYRIHYQVTDCGGNVANAFAEVRVPHSRSGGAHAASGFDPEGDDFAPDAQTFALVVSSVPRTGNGDVELLGPISALPNALELAAGAIDLGQAYVGNGMGVITPLRAALADANGDGLSDLVCFYDVGAVRAIQRVSSAEDGAIGLHFSTLDNSDYLVPDIFRLGSPTGLPTVTEVALGAGRGVSDPAAGPGEEASPGPQAVAELGGPLKTELVGVYPNPLRGTATVAFSLASEQPVDLAVYDVRGTRVVTLANGIREPGRHLLSWNGRDPNGRSLSGIYFVRFAAGAQRSARKIAVMP